MREWAKRHRTLVLLGLPHERSLLEWVQNLTDEGILTAGFREPDRNHELTAVAVHPATDGHRFRRLSLL
ncbi:MAG: hypothetical protein K1Y36_23420 [Blastocatellia bacterium]|nr:hypothetical protein [Blastocatellia bacterium]